jgi:Cd2+/Zn2+-exporting ATPase
MNRQAGFLERHRDFLLSWKTLVTLGNGLLLLAGLITSWAAGSDVGKWVYLASALLGGVPIVARALWGVLHGDILIDLMVAVAMIASIIVGEYTAAALVVFMLSLGEALEDFTVSRADNALKDLARLVPSLVTVCREGGELVVPIGQVVPDDIVLVRSGERIGVDGTVISGNASVNQAAITGESVPVEKQEHDTVFAGTLNELGAIQVRVTNLGDKTTLGQIIRLTEEAQQTQAPVQRLTHRCATVLVPLTFVIAGSVYLLTQEILRSITVLVVMCPCAFILATPTALVAAIGNAARRGILVKAGVSIEQAGKVDVVAFDKTGTLTRGKLVVQEVISFKVEGADTLLGLAAAVERFSEHPIGRAIVSTAAERGIEAGEPVDFSVMPGFGVKARIGSREVIAGNRAMIKKQGVALTDVVEDAAKVLEQQGRTTILVAVAGEAEGIIGLADEIRAEAKATVSELKKLGVSRVLLVTGDSAGVAERIAKDLDIDRFYADALPQDKMGILRKLQAEGKKVAFVGDGVNDAPALAAADIGIAMGASGTDLALETADVSLMKDDISRVPYVIGLSRKSLKVIWTNIAFSMSINILAVVLGGFGVIGPVFGALMHELSALPVLANSARLVNYRRKRQAGHLHDTLQGESEEHAHAHSHEAVTHTHLHNHDDMHHLHQHGEVLKEAHTHAHKHPVLSHAHLHQHGDDIHHRHEHEAFKGA